MLSPLELTGRSATHGRADADWKCTLHERAGAAFSSMRGAACAAGIQLEVVSAYRDFQRQVAIWSDKFSGRRPLLDPSGRPIARDSLDESGTVDAILVWSALPGASRHHWGTEIDLVDTACLGDGPPRLVAEEFAAGGCFERLAGWLQQNMARFGFFRPYATDRGGVQPEPWHLSYAEISVPALEALSVDVVKDAIAAAEMPGRDIVLARLPELYQRYVSAVDGVPAGTQSCLVAQTRLI
jgi:LAS superfamily LD-carboxypeptidase LdcB